MPPAGDQHHPRGEQSNRLTNPWIAAGASPKEVARRAGHTSVKTVLDVYGHLYDEADAALRERLEAMFVPVATLPGPDSCGPSAAQAMVRTLQEHAGRAGTLGLTSENEGWACQDLNLGPHPYQ